MIWVGQERSLDVSSGCGFLPAIVPTTTHATARPNSKNRTWMKKSPTLYYRVYLRMTMRQQDGSTSPQSQGKADVCTFNPNSAAISRETAHWPLSGSAIRRSHPRHRAYSRRLSQ